MSFDGSRYIKIDGEALRNSSDDEDARPLDVFLDWALRSNVRHLIEQGHKVSLTPMAENAGSWSTYSGERPLASVRETTAWLLPWYYQPGLDRIDVGVVARFADEDSGSVAQAQLRVTPYQLTGDEVRPRRGGTITANTQGQTPQVNAHQVSISLDFEITTDAYIAPLAIGVLSLTGTTVLDGDEPAATNNPEDTVFINNVGGDYYADTSSARPNADALDLQMTRFTGRSGDDTGDYDHLIERDDEAYMTLAPRPGQPNTVGKRHLGYVQLRGLEVHSRFTDITLTPDDRLRALQAIVGEVEAEHLLRLEQLRRRARPICVGPVGDVPPVETGWPDGYTMRWSRTQGGSRGDLFAGKGQGWLDSTNPRVLVMANVCPYFLSRLSVDDPGDDYLGKLEEVSGRATWVLKARVLQLQDGDADWGDATVLGSNYSDATIPAIRPTHWPIDWSGRSTLLRQLSFYHAGSSTETYTYREGQLYAGDEALLETLAVEIELTYPVETDRPVRVVFEPEVVVDDVLLVDGLDASLEGRISGGGVSVSASASDFYMLCVGASAWELPG